MIKIDKTNFKFVNKENLSSILGFVKFYIDNSFSLKSHEHTEYALKTTKINGHPLSGDITLTADDLDIMTKSQADELIELLRQYIEINGGGNGSSNSGNSGDVGDSDSNSDSDVNGDSDSDSDSDYIDEDDSDSNNYGK